MVTVDLPRVDSIIVFSRVPTLESSPTAAATSCRLHFARSWPAHDATTSRCTTTSGLTDSVESRCGAVAICLSIAVAAAFGWPRGA